MRKSNDPLQSFRESLLKLLDEKNTDQFLKTFQAVNPIMPFLSSKLKTDNHPKTGVVFMTRVLKLGNQQVFEHLISI